MHIKEAQGEVYEDTSPSFRIRTLCHPTGSDVWCGRPRMLTTFDLLRVTFPRIGRNLIFRSLSGDKDSRTIEF